MATIAESTGERHGFCLVPATDFHSRKLCEARWELTKYQFSSIQGDLFQYMLDTMKWIPTTYGSLGNVPFDHPVIETNGLAVAKSVFAGWERLFSLAPDPIVIRGPYSLKGSTIGQLYVRLSRDEVLSSLREVISAIDQAIGSAAFLMWDVRYNF
jgi:hypothetical protein